MTILSKSLNRISKKFICGIVAILFFTLLTALLINTKFIARFYLNQQTDYVRSVGTQLESLLSRGYTPDAAINELENSEKVLIAFVKNTENSEILSDELRERFRQKGLGFQKFWLWEKDHADILKDGKKFRLYQQDKLNYGILTEYITASDGMFAIASIVPATSATVKIINQCLIILMAFTLLLSTLLIYILVKHITTPLHKIEDFSKKIILQQYEPLRIHTNDELEVVAESMNQMSQSIQAYQQLLIDKNKQMELLLDNVAHDLKTPISLIGMYASGIKDNLDDGTFLDTIIKQNEKMSSLVKELLGYSRIGQKNYPSSLLSLDQLLFQVIDEMSILAKARGITFSCLVSPDLFITGNPELITTLYSNLLSNAIKYACGNGIYISLTQIENSHYLFSVTNHYASSDLDLTQIWEPFYVGEASRNKEMSGTGLGLPIVKKIAEQAGFSVSCRCEDHHTIIFEVIF